MFLFKNHFNESQNWIGYNRQRQICTDLHRLQDRTRMRNCDDSRFMNAFDHRIYIMRSASSVSNEGTHKYPSYELRIASAWIPIKVVV
ncbi:hypothetical protein ALC53_04445 [Atta colombica]|uniref:Uncharacterized protein n=1 Tax=Atta colombica TaxID=520822 RepID=A0A195BLL9_9HYME|nr:hypothetical protein ALC53_04445 [Atta colombica]